MKVNFLLTTILLTGNIIGLTTVNIDKDLKDINSKILQINSELNQQQEKQHSIDNTIKNYDLAINQSNTLLNKLRKQKDYNLQQLSYTQDNLNILKLSLNQTKEQTDYLIKSIYHQIEKITVQNQSIFLETDTTEIDRKKMYLILILKDKQKKLSVLQNKINSLNLLESQIQDQLNIINAKLSIATQYQHKLQINDMQQAAVAKNLQQKIQDNQSNLSRLERKKQSTTRKILF